LKKLIVQDTLVSLTRVNDDDYISLTDIARVRNPDEPKDVVKNWLRNRSTVEYLGLWEKINNAAFKGVEFDPFAIQSGWPGRNSAQQSVGLVMRHCPWQA
jgi:hypothetical protein